ncbi:MAG: BON domain-containing protein [Actinomycetota bacterium]
MRFKRLGWIAGAGAGLMYFFDPRMGRTRRAQLAQRMGGMVRRGTQKAERQGRYMAGHALGVKEKMAAATRQQAQPPNDPALVQKIQSEVLSGWNYPKGDILIDADEGVVYLRGMAETPEQIKQLEKEVRKVTGVAEVVNLLHLPGQPAPNKQEAIEASRS